MKLLKLIIAGLVLSNSVRAQDLVNIVRWVSPVTGDSETLREDFYSDAQLLGWGYKDKLFQFSAYKTRPSAPNTTAVNRWVMPNCAASIIIAEHEIPEATLLSWGYKNKQFLFYAFRTKPATGDFMAVNRWINAIPEGDKCRDFTLTVAETEFTDDQLLSYGYSGKITQFWVPRPGQVMPDKPVSVLPVRLVNSGFETGNLTGWTQFGRGFEKKEGDIPQSVNNWGPSSMPLGGDYWKDLTPHFSWNNGREGNWFAGSSQTATGSLLSSEFVPQKKFVTFLFGGKATTLADKNNLRVELLVLNNGTFPSSYQKSVIRERLPQINGAGQVQYNGIPIRTLVSTPFPQVTLEGKSYYLIEDLTIRGDILQSPDLFVRVSFNLSEIGQTNNSRATSSVRPSLMGRKLRLRVVDETTQGYLYFDDVRIEDSEGRAVTVQAPRAPLWGFADMHTHPMSHLGFGKKLMHGAPDIGSLIPAGTRDCTSPSFRARNVQDALGSCNPTHGGHGADNPCGNYLRAAVISKAFDKNFVHNTTSHNPFDQGGNAHGDHQHSGIEASFLYWPHQTSMVHQQMWWEWLKRAYDGGLRTMVALAVNSELLATVIDGDAPQDDKSTSDLQIDEIISFVNRHSDFMAVARSASEMRQIVRQNKLAIVLGVEVDNIGNFNRPDVLCNETTVKAEVQRLYTKGVRYIFPIHVVDNKFGGTAVYEDLFNLANKYATGNLFTVSTSPDPKITYRLGSGLDENGNLGIKVVIDAASNIPFPPAFNLFSCPVPTLGCWDKFKFLSGLVAPDRRYATYANTPGGHVNSKGLTSLGRVAVREMMRLGMLIDLDHMSQQSMEMTVQLAEEIEGGYPLNIGHNGIRSKDGNERGVDSLIARKSISMGGMFGIGTEDTNALKFIVAADSISNAIGQHYFAFGTDANGMIRLPQAVAGLSETTFYNGFRKCRMEWTTGSREWDFTKEGVAHYGLIPDFLQDISSHENSKNTLSGLFSGAEYFARMWERCEQQKTQVR